MVWSIPSLIIGLIVGGLIGYWIAAAPRTGQQGAQTAGGGQRNAGQTKMANAFSAETGTIGETDPTQTYGQDPVKPASSSALAFVKNEQQDDCAWGTATHLTHQNATSAAGTTEAGHTTHQAGRQNNTANKTGGNQGGLLGETTGTVGGAAVGAAVGSVLGPVGTAVGGIAGGAWGNQVGEQAESDKNKGKQTGIENE